jgi:polyisoprenyl-phosphate glycosyltransferase
MPDPSPGGQDVAAARGGIELAVVVPVFRSPACLRQFHHRLVPVLERLVDGYEIVLVDDGSGDRSWEVIEELAAADYHVRGLRLDRNHGQSVAILAGLDHTHARWVAVMDCDLQDSPEALGEMLELVRCGHEAVAARRSTGLLARGAFAILNAVATTRHDPCAGSYRLVGPSVVDELRRRLRAGAVFSLSVNELATVASVDVPRGPRAAGRSSYDLTKRLSVFIRALVVHGGLPGARLLLSDHVVEARTR